MSASSKLTSQSFFQFKASFSPCMILELLRDDIDGIKTHLSETVNNTPQFFAGAPVVIELDKLRPTDNPPLAEIKQILVEHGITPIGVRGGSAALQQVAAMAGLPMVKVGKQTSSEPVKHKAATNTPAAAAPAVASPSKLITQPIRSGMQIYAKEGDLIVTTQVSPGAELMADGHIHVYGTLRGRALAGVHGNQDARIFCRGLEAELVAIAGYYLTRDEIVLPEDTSRSIQIYLHNEKILIESL